MSYNRVYVQRSTTFGTLKPLDTENAEVSDISWTKLNTKGTKYRLGELYHQSQTNTKLLEIPLQSKLQPELDNQEQAVIVILEDAQVHQEA